MSDEGSISGKELRELREKAGLSLRVMGEQLGVSHVTVWEWEEEKRPIPMALLGKVAATLGVKSNRLLWSCSKCHRPF